MTSIIWKDIESALQQATFVRDTSNPALDRLRDVLSKHKNDLLKPLEVTPPDDNSRRQLQEGTVTVNGKALKLKANVLRDIANLSDELLLHHSECAKLVQRATAERAAHGEQSVLRIALHLHFEDRYGLLYNLATLFKARADDSLGAEMRHAVREFTDELLNNSPSLIDNLCTLITSLGTLSNASSPHAALRAVYHYQERRMLAECLLFIFYQTTCSAANAMSLLAVVHACSESLSAAEAELAGAADNGDSGATDDGSRAQLQLNRDAHFQLTYTLVLVLACALDAKHDLSHAKTGTTRDDGNAALLEDGSFVDKFHQTLTVTLSWRHSGVQAAVRLAWANFASTRSETKRGGALSDDAVNQLYEQALGAEGRALQYLTNVVTAPCFVGDADNHHILMGVVDELVSGLLARLAFTNFAACPPVPAVPIVETPGRTEGNTAVAASSRAVSGAGVSSTTSAEYDAFADLLRLVTAVYADEEALAERFWHDEPSADDGLHFFLCFAADHVRPALFVPFMRMLIALAGGASCSQHAFHFLRAYRSRYVSLDHFLGAIARYRNDLAPTPSDALPGVYGGDLQRAGQKRMLRASDADALVVVLELLSVCLAHSPQARSLCNDVIGGGGLVQACIQLMCCAVPAAVKGALCDVVATYAQSATAAGAIWQCLEAAQILSTRGAVGAADGGSAAVRDVRWELDEVEARAGTFPFARSLTRLVALLVRFGVPSGPRTTLSVCFDAYFSFVRDRVLLRAFDRRYVQSGERWLVAHRALRVMLTVMTCCATVSVDDITKMPPTDIVAFLRTPGAVAVASLLRDDHEGSLLRVLVRVLDEARAEEEKGEAVAGTDVSVRRGAARMALMCLCMGVERGAAVLAALRRGDASDVSNAQHRWRMGSDAPLGGHGNGVAAAPEHTGVARSIGVRLMYEKGQAVANVARLCAALLASSPLVSAAPPQPSASPLPCAPVSSALHVIYHGVRLLRLLSAENVSVTAALYAWDAARAAAVAVSRAVESCNDVRGGHSGADGDVARLDALQQVDILCALLPGDFDGHEVREQHERGTLELYLPDIGAECLRLLLNSPPPLTRLLVLGEHTAGNGDGGALEDSAGSVGALHSLLTLAKRPSLSVAAPLLSLLVHRVLARLCAGASVCICHSPSSCRCSEPLLAVLRRPEHDYAAHHLTKLAESSASEGDGAQWSNTHWRREEAWRLLATAAVLRTIARDVASVARSPDFGHYRRRIVDLMLGQESTALENIAAFAKRASAGLEGALQAPNEQPSAALLAAPLSSTLQSEEKVRIEERGGEGRSGEEGASNGTRQYAVAAVHRRAQALVEHALNSDVAWSQSQIDLMRNDARAVVEYAARCNAHALVARAQCALLSAWRGAVESLMLLPDVQDASSLVRATRCAARLVAARDVPVAATEIASRAMTALVVAARRTVSAVPHIESGEHIDGLVAVAESVAAAVQRPDGTAYLRGNVYAALLHVASLLAERGSSLHAYVPPGTLGAAVVSALRDADAELRNDTKGERGISVNSEQDEWRWQPLACGVVAVLGAELGEDEWASVGGGAAVTERLFSASSLQALHAQAVKGSVAALGALQSRCSVLVALLVGQGGAGMRHVGVAAGALASMAAWPLTQDEDSDVGATSGGQWDATRGWAPERGELRERIARSVLEVAAAAAVRELRRANDSSASATLYKSSHNGSSLAPAVCRFVDAQCDLLVRSMRVQARVSERRLVLCRLAGELCCHVMSLPLAASMLPAQTLQRVVGSAIDCVHTLAGDAQHAWQKRVVIGDLLSYSEAQPHQREGVCRAAAAAARSSAALLRVVCDSEAPRLCIYSQRDLANAVQCVHTVTTDVERHYDELLQFRRRRDALGDVDDADVSRWVKERGLAVGGTSAADSAGGGGASLRQRAVAHADETLARMQEHLDDLVYTLENVLVLLLWHVDMLSPQHAAAAGISQREADDMLDVVGDHLRRVHRPSNQTVLDHLASLDSHMPNVVDSFVFAAQKQLRAMISSAR